MKNNKLNKKLKLGMKSKNGKERKTTETEQESRNGVEA